MAKKYTGSLTLDWYNKQKSIMVKSTNDLVGENESLAPKVNWINNDEALFYEIVDEDGRGLNPYWVNQNDIRIKETRPLILQKVYKAVQKDRPGTIPGTYIEWELAESKKDDSTVENLLIKGDNLLALNTLKKVFSNKPDNEKVKCIYIDPPYNTGVAFENYDDGLAHSEWLTMMRDRLVILRELLQERGTIFVSIDNNEACYLQVLMDGVFGRENRKNIITLKRGSVTGAKVINPGLVNISEFILVYSKNHESWEPNRVFKSKERDERYNSFIENVDDDCSKWRYISLLEAFAKDKGVDKRELKSKFGESLEIELNNFVYENAESVMQFASLDENSVSKEAVRIKKLSEKDNIKTYVLEREGKRPYYIFKGKLILFVKDRLMSIDGRLTFSEPVTDIWDDVLPNDLHNEGGVEFRKGKKPEKLIQRLIDLSTNEGDLVLDCFGGSGSTFAVSHKMNRKWIGIEIGAHAETHIIPRLKSVLEGADKAGITKSINWQGGGSFKYYHLGPSIIKINKDGFGDFNWSLGCKFIEESLLSSYDYTIDSEISLAKGELFQNQSDQPTIGIQKIGSKTRIAIVSLNPPRGDKEVFTYDEVMHIYNVVSKTYSPDFVNIFTNRGIEMAYDSKPEGLEIIKVPHAIFAELEK